MGGAGMTGMAGHGYGAGMSAYGGMGGRMGRQV